MKTRFKIVAIMGIVMFFSCKKENNPTPKENSCKKTNTTISRDGYPTGEKVYRYNSQSQLSVELVYDDLGILTDSIFHTYNSDNKLISSYYYNLVYMIEQLETWDYTINNKVEKYNLIENGKNVGSRKYFYNSKNEIDSIYSTYSEVASRLYYSYLEDTLREIKIYDESNTLTQRNVYSYDQFTTLITNFDGNNNVLFTSITKSNELGQEVNWKQLDSDGNISISRTTSYDEHGNVVKVNDYYEGSGEYEYITHWDCT